jgi:hypothetical protein
LSDPLGLARGLGEAVTNLSAIGHSLRLAARDKGFMTLLRLWRLRNVC